MFILDDYPSDAIGASCFFTRSPKGEITYVDAETGEDRVRTERIISTDRYVEHEGRVAISEKFVIHLGDQVGMVAGWRLERAQRMYEEALAELAELSTGEALLREQNLTLASMANGTAREIFVAADGSRHTSLRAAVEASRKQAGLESSVR